MWEAEFASRDEVTPEMVTAVVVHGILHYLSPLANSSIP